ncbi:MAG: tRNA (adenosine(37)-N6)-threonylcarbamoyltransferase complex dimerization subunit type 1 TsaB [Erysipelotrichales bacterium]|nr:tRNA (adenosine(37)-N6)-threonylcarbamoyltransferase complex dimerization subunit type 1 TsaB [Erysipelotrichales bacterium]
MISILLDSSDKFLAVGIAKDGVLIDSIQYEAWQRQSEMMITELESIIKRNNINRFDITNVVCGIGPGSYTGVRISLTIAKVMAMALSIPLFTVSSLRILKDNNNPSICVINARSGRSYVGVFENEKIVLSDKIMKNDELLYFIKAHPSYVVCGDTKHLDIDGKVSNVLEQMTSLLPYLKEEKNHLGVTPIYMKD